MKSWAASLALHALAAGLVSVFWLHGRMETDAPPLRWQIRFTPPPVVAELSSRQKPPIPAPPTPTPAPPTPAPPTPAPPTPAPPTPAPPASQPPSQPPLSAPQPLAQAVPRESALVAVVPASPPRMEAVASVQSAAAMPVPTITAPATFVPAPAKTVPTPVSAPSHGTLAAEIERRWHLVLIERLRDMKRYPMAARRLGQEGVVVVEARIALDGRMEGATVKHGSGFTLLDNDALRLMEIAAEAARAQLRPERPTRVEVPIAYRLEQ